MMKKFLGLFSMALMCFGPDRSRDSARTRRSGTGHNWSTADAGEDHA